MSDQTDKKESKVSKIAGLFGFTSIDNDEVESSLKQDVDYDGELKYIEEKYGNGKNQKAFEYFTREILIKKQKAAESKKDISD